MFKIIITLGLTCILTTHGLKSPILTDFLFQDANNPETTVENKTINYRLPAHVKPNNYIITLTPYFDGDKKFTFDGTVAINIDVLQNVNNITLHSKNLTFSANNVALTRETPGKKQELKIEFDDERNFVIIRKSDGSDIEKNKYTLEINYVGKLADDMRGFYRSSYINEKGERVWLATTHFEPVAARRAFPCFDEPALKATFEILINHHKNYTAVSNMEVSEIQGTEQKTTIFKKTPLMSTYLLAFVVSDFKNMTDTKKNFTVLARPNAIEHGNLALNSGLQSLQALENFTQVSYEIGKMDQIAVPDFPAGAMENWGLVIYTEKSLLFDDKTMTTDEKQNIVETIAHEFAHQWFGNLISPKWWKYIWLNEGFAHFFQSYITDKVEPKWRSVEQSVIKSIQTSTFDYDCESKTHPINHDVESPKEISALFDTISYKKGGAVIRMMQHFLTEPIFQKGLNNYLTNSSLAHNAADSDDLFNAIQKAVTDEKIKDLDVLAIMNTWVNYKGYPVVKVDSSDPKSIKVTQERFYTPTEEEKKEKKHFWNIPINYATDTDLEFDNTTNKFWLKTESETLPITINDNGFIILNKQQTGYYRVQYDQKNWKQITKYLNSKNFTNIHVLNRAQLLNDALAFAKQKQSDLQILLELSDYLKNEDDYIAWYPGFKIFSWLKSRLINTKIYPAFKTFASNRIKPLVEKVGLEEKSNEPKDEYLTKLNRITAANWACALDIELKETCTSKMQKKLEDWLNTPTTVITPDLKKLTLCGGLRKANLNIWEKVLNKTVDAKTKPNEKTELMSALACSSDRSILEHYFNYTTKENSALENDTVTVVQYIYQNSEIGVDVALHLLSTRLAAFFMKTQIDKETVYNLILDVSKKITLPEQLTKLQSITDVPQKILNPAKEAAQKNIDWLTENEDFIKTIIDKLDNNGVNIFTSSILLISSMFMILFITS